MFPVIEIEKEFRICRNFEEFQNPKAIKMMEELLGIDTKLELIWGTVRERRRKEKRISSSLLISI